MLKTGGLIEERLPRRRHAGRERHPHAEAGPVRRLHRHRHVHGLQRARRRRRRRRRSRSCPLRRCPAAAAAATITTPGQDAWFAFSGTAGQRIAIKIAGSFLKSGSLDITDPSDNALGGTIAFGVSGGWGDPVALPLTGTYKIQAPANGASTGNIVLSAYIVPADVTASVVPGGPAATLATTIPGQNMRGHVRRHRRPRRPRAGLRLDDRRTVKILRGRRHHGARLGHGLDRRRPDRRDHAAGHGDLHGARRPEDLGHRHGLRQGRRRARRHQPARCR